MLTCQLQIALILVEKSIMLRHLPRAHRLTIDLRWQRHGAHNSRTCASDGVHDLACSTVNHSVVVRLEPNADLLSRHGVVSFFSCFRPSTRRASVTLCRLCRLTMTDPRGRACRLILAEKFSLLPQAPTALLLIGCSVRTRMVQIHRSDSVSGCSRYHYRSAGVNAQNATSLSWHRALHPRNSGNGSCEGTLKDGENPIRAGRPSDALR